MMFLSFCLFCCFSVWIVFLVGLVVLVFGIGFVVVLYLFDELMMEEYWKVFEVLQFVGYLVVGLILLLVQFELLMKVEVFDWWVKGGDLLCWVCVVVGLGGEGYEVILDFFVGKVD